MEQITGNPYTDRYPEFTPDGGWLLFGSNRYAGGGPGDLWIMPLEGSGVPVRLYVYPGEGHGTRQPVHQLDKLEKGFAWFQKYLGR